MEILYGVLAAFGGGVMGAALGALPMFIMMGFVGFIGAALQMSGAGTLSMFTGDVIFGALTGPQIAFGGGVAAAAFAAHRKELLDTGSDILTPLYKTNSAAVILTGGIFGSLGYLFHSWLTSVGYPGNPVATSLLLSGILARILFGHKGLATKRSVKEKELAELKKASRKKTGFLNMKASEMNLVIAIGIGLVFSYAALKTGVAEFGFYFSAASLILLQFGYSVPLTHHITLTCSIAALKTGNIWIGVAFAVIAWIVAELWQNYVNAKDDTWLDTPSGSIAICALILLFV